MDIDATVLARIQFAFTITFHIIFPSFTIGLAAFIATLLVRWRITGEDHLHRLARFWTKIFAVSFAMVMWGQIVLQPHLAGVAFALYWSACFGLSIVAAMIGVLDVRAMLRNLRTERLALLRRAMRDIKLSKDRSGTALLK